MRSLAAIPPEQWLRIEGHLRPRRFLKGELFLKPGDPSVEVGIVVDDAIMVLENIGIIDGQNFVVLVGHENHLRAGLGLPLARTEPTHPAALMVNLLWPPSEKEFAPIFSRLTCGPAWPENVKLHWYGKSEIRPRRKMGHFTVYGSKLDECRDTARQILASRWVQG